MDFAYSRGWHSLVLERGRQQIGGDRQWYWTRGEGGRGSPLRFPTRAEGSAESAEPLYLDGCSIVQQLGDMIS